MGKVFILVEEKLTTLKVFLEAIPPSTEININGFKLEKIQYTNGLKLEFPSIELYCSSSNCGGIRFFDSTDNTTLYTSKRIKAFANYHCRNCKSFFKTYALSLMLNNDDKTAKSFKYGENPSFGPHTPRKTLEITGQEKEYFLKGRQSENQGLGIAAFAYYRRVVENQKSKILDEIIRVSKALAAPQEMLADLENAKKETQFSKAVESIKHGIPQALMIQGHNPLTLLHDALSEGLHAQSDEECLLFATSIRRILSELVEKISIALKDEDELNTAVSVLLKAKAARAANKR